MIVGFIAERLCSSGVTSLTETEMEVFLHLEDHREKTGVKNGAANEDERDRDIQDKVFDANQEEDEELPRCEVKEGTTAAHP